MKNLVLILLSLLFIIGCDRPKGFTLKKVTSSYPTEKCWDVQNDLSKEELTKLLEGPYHYLGSGNHTYAFESPDRKAVIKFFKQKHMRVQSPLITVKTKKRRAKEREESFSSYKLAFERLREETGLLYLHLNQTHHLNKKLTLLDQHGDKVIVNLDDMEFLIQKKATLAFDHLEKLFSEGAYDKALISIRSLFNLIAKRNMLGIYDRDLQFFKNFGFIDNDAIEIDIGEFRLDQSIHTTYEELHELSHQIKDFVNQKAPEFSPIANHVIDRDIESYR